EGIACQHGPGRQAHRDPQIDPRDAAPRSPPQSGADLSHHLSRGARWPWSSVNRGGGLAHFTAHGNALLGQWATKWAGVSGELPVSYLLLAHLAHLKGVITSRFESAGQ